MATSLDRMISGIIEIRVQLVSRISLALAISPISRFHPMSVNTPCRSADS